MQGSPGGPRPAAIDARYSQDRYEVRVAGLGERLAVFEGREQPLLVLAALLLAAHVANHTIAEETVDVAPTVITSATLLAALLYRVLPKLIVAAIALFAGITHTIGGIAHIVELVGGDPEGGDYTGPVSTVGSLLLLAVAGFIIQKWVASRRRRA
jgi:hypothetical protein